MTASKHVTLWCDDDVCMAWTDFGDRRVEETRRKARLHGWVRVDGKDFCCPEHATRQEKRDDQ